MDNKTVNVLFIWKVDEELKKYLVEGLQSYQNINLIFPEEPLDEVYLKYISNADIIVGWRPTKELLEKASKLSLFINPGVGVQHLTSLFKELNQSRKITLVNGHGNTYFTAQHAVALLLSLTNKIIPHHQWMKNREWRKGDEDAISIPLRERKIGLLGYGAINTKVHKFLAGFDVEFHILKRDWKRVRVENYPTNFTKYSPNQLDDFLKTIDILIVALPLTAQSRELLKKRELELIGENGLLVTVARGEIINEKDLYEVLRDNKIAGAAIDVWYNYRPEPDESGGKFPSKYPFYELDNVILSPHRGASPMSDLKRWNEVIENISRFSKGLNNFLNEVNLELEY